MLYYDLGYERWTRYYKKHHFTVVLLFLNCLSFSWSTFNIWPSKFSILWNFSKSSFNVKVLPMSLPSVTFSFFRLQLAHFTFSVYFILVVTVFLLYFHLLKNYIFLFIHFLKMSHGFITRRKICNTISTLSYLCLNRILDVLCDQLLTNCVRSDVIGHLSWCLFVIYIMLMWLEQSAAKSVL